MKKLDAIYSKDLVNYEDALSFMKKRVEGIIKNDENEAIWFLEHPHLYTAGRSFEKNELLNKNLPVYYTDRGGKFTYHGPGQRIVYLMLNLKNVFSGHPDVRLFIKLLEKWVIDTLAEFNVMGSTKNNMIGIWVRYKNQERKIAAIGIKVRKWITFHGVAININPNLNYYNNIIPCGIMDYGVTSLHKINKAINIKGFDLVLMDKFCKIFGYTIVKKSYKI